MTDEQNWQAPGATAGANTPQWGAYAPYQGPAGGGGQGGGTPGWTPPPKPGLIPLRPIGFGQLMMAPFQVLRRNPKATFGSALLIQGALLFLTLLIVGLVTWFAVSRIETAQSGDEDVISAGSIALIVLSGLVTLGISLVASAFLQGLIVLEAARATLGEKLTLAQVWRATAPRLPALILWVLLVTVAVLIPLALLGGLVALIVSQGGVLIAAGVVLGVVGLLAFVVAAAWVGTKFSIVPSIIVLERLGIRAAVQRSWLLTNGFFWRTLGVQLLVYTILSFAAQIITTPFSLLLPLVGLIIDPTGTGAAIGFMIASYVLVMAFSVIVGAATSVVQSALVALIYIDLRMRKEGLDLELTRFVEDRQAGRATVADPYLPRSFTAAPAA